MNDFKNRIEAKEKELEGFKIHYFGSLPKRRSVFISASNNNSPINRASLYASAFEAALLGFDVIYMPYLGRSEPIENGVLDGEGRFHLVLPKGLHAISWRKISKAIIYGGSVLSGSLDREFSIAEVKRAKSIASLISDAVVVGESVKDASFGSYLSDALDRGKDVAILKSSLSGAYLKSLVKDGCPAISLFSDFVINPHSFLYPCGKSRYSQDGFCFDIMRVGE